MANRTYNIEYKGNYNSSEFLRLNFARRFTNESKTLRSTEFTVLRNTDYHLFFSSSGVIQIESAGLSYKMSDYSLIIMRPEGKQKITQYPSSTYVHCIFSGSVVRELLSSLNLPLNQLINTEFSSSSPDKLLFLNQNAEYMLSEFRHDNKYSDIRCVGMLIDFLSLCSRYIVENEKDTEIMNMKYITEYIITQSDVNIEDLLRYANMSRSSFFRMFKKYTGTSPKQYKQDYSLAVAKDYLKIYEKMPVSKVAEKVGISNPLYFSRLFKKKYGISPTEYAKEEHSLS